VSCITSSSYSILINATAPNFFHAERGLRQGLPLSPLLFLLIMEGLSRLISTARSSGDLHGVKMTEVIYLVDSRLLRSSFCVMLFSRVIAFLILLYRHFELASMVYLKHLLFADNVLIFLDGSIRYSTNFMQILSLFCKAIKMTLNHNKSTIMTINCSLNE